jgi:hypothetical protein
MFKLRVTGLASMICLLVACTHGGKHEHTSVFQHLSIQNDGGVIAHAHDGSDARIAATGDLQIRDRHVAVNPAQRELLKAYHDDALTLRDDAVATAGAGARTGLTALDAVATGLARGDPDSIDAKVEPEADKVDALAQTVCRDLAQLHAAQEKLVAAVPPFRPYATIESHEVSDCDRG